MNNSFSKTVLGILALICFFWTLVVGVTTVIIASTVDPRAWLPISGVATALVFSAIIKLEGK